MSTSIRFTVTSLTLAALALVACGKSSSSSAGSTSSSATTTSAGPAPKGGSCLEEKAGVCTEYGDNPLGMAEGACTSMFKGTYQKTACPTADLMGVCERKDDKQYYYFGNGVAPWVSDAKKDCEQNPLSPGKWVPQPNAEQAAKDKAIPAASKIAGSCKKKDGSCDDIHGRLADMEKSTCEELGGTYATTPCSTENLVGSCAKHGKVSRYYTDSLKTFSVKELTENCEDALSEGHYYPGPAAPAAAAAKGGGGAKGGLAAPAAKAAGGGANAKGAAGGGGAAPAKKAK
jgi:hypothetical protein